ncbi:MAG: Ig-like domain repeat protein, partial [Acidimicrobiales bacterium]
ISPPASVTAGTATSFTVRVEDPFGNRVTSGTGSHDAITVSGANCSSDTVHATAGQAAFPACVLPTSAGTHTVTASDTTIGDTGITPASATVLVDAGPASQLFFTAPPTSVTVGQTFPLTVLVTDGFGNRIRTGTGSSDTIVLSGSSLACASATTEMASAGAATFAGCTLSTPPSATLTAGDTTPGDTGFTPATAVVSVLRGSTHISLTSSANPGTVGTPIAYTARVHSTAPSVGVPSGNVEFVADGHPVSGCTAQPLSGGTATCTVTYVLLTMQTVVAKYLGTPGYGPSTSPTTTETLIGNGLDVSESAGSTNPNPSTVDLAPLSLGSSSGMHAAQGSLNIIHVADNRGTAAGWTVTGQLQGNFVNATPSGNRADNSIPASDLLWLPTVITGSATGVVAGPASALSKTVAKVLCSATSGHGAGNSSCSGTLTLAIPPTVAAGRYTAVLEIVVS